MSGKGGEIGLMSNIASVLKAPIEQGTTAAGNPQSVRDGDWRGNSPGDSAAGARSLSDVPAIKVPTLD
ncbi:hypothetical protein [Halomicronema sp. CCY15110]|uniref:hypothetical protein n=1 Tax=Halomicronema sp. CCY15110 TaxID=2767773 RepID=UPI001951723C|nr:hypothetical protein [Halomicronema sp. CCY15110]